MSWRGQFTDNFQRLWKAFGGPAESQVDDLIIPVIAIPFFRPQEHPLHAEFGIAGVSAGGSFASFTCIKPGWYRAHLDVNARVLTNPIQFVMTLGNETTAVETRLIGVKNPGQTEHCEIGPVYLYKNWTIAFFRTQATVAGDDVSYHCDVVELLAGG